TAIGERTPSTKHAEQDARRHARQSKDHADCRAATIRPSLAEIALALSSRCDNHNVAATAKMAILIVALQVGAGQIVETSKRPPNRSCQRWRRCVNSAGLCATSLSRQRIERVLLDQREILAEQIAHGA